MADITIQIHHLYLLCMNNIKNADEHLQGILNIITNMPLEERANFEYKLVEIRTNLNLKLHNTAIELEFLDVVGPPPPPLTRH